MSKKILSIILLLVTNCLFCQVTIDDYLKGLSSSDPKVRKKAAMDLGQSGFEEDPALKNEIVTKLVEALKKESNANVKIEVLRTLGLIRAYSSTSEISNFLKDPEPKVRSMTARVFGNLRDRATVELLISALNDKNERVVEYVVWALGKINDEKAVPAVLSLVKKKEADKKIRWQAANALWNMHREEAVNCFKEIIKEKQEGDLFEFVIQCLSTTKDKTLTKFFLDVLKNKNPKVKISGINGLVNLEDTSSLTSIRNLLKDRDKNVRRTVCFAIGRLGDESDIPVLENLAKRDINKYVRNAASDAIEMIKYRLKK